MLLISMKSLYYLIFYNNNYHFVSAPCAPENVFNFTASNRLLAWRSPICLACLFNGAQPQPGTLWLVNGQMSTSMNDTIQVNANGTLVIKEPPGQATLTCRRGGNMFNIWFRGELYNTA